MQLLSASSRLILLACSFVLLPGCFSLSLGGKTCTGDHPETKARISSLEMRVSELEQVIAPAGATLAQPNNAYEEVQGQQISYGKN